MFSFILSSFLINIGSNSVGQNSKYPDGTQHQNSYQRRDRYVSPVQSYAPVDDRSVLYRYKYFLFIHSLSHPLRFVRVHPQPRWHFFRRRLQKNIEWLSKVGFFADYTDKNLMILLNLNALLKSSQECLTLVCVQHLIFHNHLSAFFNANWKSLFLTIFNLHY